MSWPERSPKDGCDRTRKQRGAVMVEMLVVLPILILLWMGIDYFRTGYLLRLEMLAQSQAEAWKLASSNDGACFQNGTQSGWSDLTGGGGNSDLQSADQTDAGGAYKERANIHSSIFMFAHARSHKSAATAAAQWKGGQSMPVSGGTYVMCNEVVPVNVAGADQFADQDIFTPLWDFFSAIIGGNL